MSDNTVKRESAVIIDDPDFKKEQVPTIPFDMFEPQISHPRACPQEPR